MVKPKTKIERFKVKIGKGKAYLITPKGLVMLHHIFDPTTKLIIEVERRATSD